MAFGNISLSANTKAEL